MEDVQSALAAMRTKEDGSPVRPATVNTYVAAVKSFLGFAHRVAFTRFNAAPLIKLKKAPRQVAQRIWGAGRAHAYQGCQTRPRSAHAGCGLLRGPARLRACQSDLGPGHPSRQREAQLEIVGEGDKVRQVLIPAEIAARLLASCGDAPASAPVFGSVRRPANPLPRAP